jgi:hypothetical protein
VGWHTAALLDLIEERRDCFGSSGFWAAALQAKAANRGGLNHMLFR